MRTSSLPAKSVENNCQFLWAESAESFNHCHSSIRKPIRFYLQSHYSLGQHVKSGKGSAVETRQTEWGAKSGIIFEFSNLFEADAFETETLLPYMVGHLILEAVIRAY